MKFEIGEIVKQGNQYWRIIKRGANSCVCEFGDRQKVILHKNMQKVCYEEAKIYKLEEVVYLNKKHIKNNSWQETRQERKRINKLLERKINEIKGGLKCL